MVHNRTPYHQAKNIFYEAEELFWWPHAWSDPYDSVDSIAKIEIFAIAKLANITQFSWCFYYIERRHNC